MVVEKWGSTAAVADARRTSQGIKNLPPAGNTSGQVLAEVAKGPRALVLRRVARRLNSTRRQSEQAAHSISLARPLIVPEVEQLVLDDRATDGPAKLLPPAGRDEAMSDRIGGELGEGVPRLLRVGAAEPECTAVNFVAARLSLGRDNAGYRFAKFRVVVLQCYFCFCDRVEIRIHHDDSENRILVIGSIKLKRGPAEVLSLSKDLLTALRVLGRGMAPSRQFLGSRSHQLQLRKISVQDGHIFHIFLIEFRGNIRAVSLELWRFCGD